MCASALRFAGHSRVILSVHRLHVARSRSFIFDTQMLRRAHNTKPTMNHEHSHSHSHSHGVFSGHSHSHSADQVVSAYSSTSDRGARITLIGLFANIALTATKGLAGFYLHSASLLADAGHSLSDLLCDVVVLASWNISKRPPTATFPFGFGKVETLGSALVSLVLIGGALGLSVHSWRMLLETLEPGTLSTLAHNITSLIPDSISHSHSHGHDIKESGDLLDPNAAWFALLSVAAKEYLYRITKKVADDESSPVLLANAYHHRSDAYSSAIVLAAILGNWYSPTLPMDPIGGLIVGAVIGKQGWGLAKGALAEFMDKGVDEQTRTAYLHALESIEKSSVRGISNLRAKRSGSSVSVDFTAHLDPHMSVSVETLQHLEEQMTSALKESRKEVKEVRVQWRRV